MANPTSQSRSIPGIIAPALIDNGDGTVTLDLTGTLPGVRLTDTPPRSIKDLLRKLVAEDSPGKIQVKLADRDVLITVGTGSGKALSTAIVDGDLGGGGGEGAPISDSILTGTFGSLPTPGTEGRLYFSTDIGVIFRDTGVVWAIVDGGPGAIDFFDANGFLPSTVRFGSTTDIPTESATILNGGSWTIIDSVAENVVGSAPTATIAGWDLPATKTEVLIATNIFRADSAGMGVIIQSAPLAGTDMTSGWLFQADGIGYRLIKVPTIATASVVAVGASILTSSTTSSPAYGLALHYDSVTGVVTGFARHTNGTWFKVVQVTDGSLGAMRTLGVRNSGVTGKLGRTITPFTIWSSA